MPKKATSPARMPNASRADEASAGSRSQDDTPERTGVQSLVRAFGLLEEIAHLPNGISLAELSKSSGLHSSTTFHIVKTMTSLGFIRQDPETKRYHVGSLLFSLARSARPETTLLRFAGPILDEVARRTGETVHLAFMCDGEVTVIARRQGSGAFQLNEKRGGRRPGHATALGKILLAFADHSDAEAYIRRHGLPRLTPKTITDKDKFWRELARIRNSEFAVDEGEYSSEVRCVAVPVRDETGAVVATIGVSGPIRNSTAEAIEARKAVMTDVITAFSSARNGKSAEQPPAKRSGGQRR